MLSTKLFLREPEELEAFARFCTDMANVQRKLRAPLEGGAMPQCAASVQQRVASLLPPPHDSLEEAQRAAGVIPITAAAVNQLRTEAQVPMMEAKSALQQAGGDMDQARTLLHVPPAIGTGIHNFDAPLAPSSPAPVGFDTAALDQDAAKLFALGVNPMTGQPVGATPPAVPLPPSSAPSTAAAAVFPTAPAALPAGPLPGSTFPVPQFAPSAAAPTAAATTSPAGGVELDADGLPWDHRIHSGSKEKNKTDNRWRAKRGVNDEAFVKRVQAELRAVMAVPVPPAAPAAPVEVAPSIPLPPAVTGSTASAPATSAADPTDFASLVAILTPKLTPERIPTIFAIVQSFGLPGLPALQQRPDLVPAVWAKLKEVLS